MPAQIISIAGKVPTSELDCAHKCHYRFLAENELEPDVAAKMTAAIRIQHNVEHGVTKRCTCMPKKLRNGKISSCSIADVCVNRIEGRSCGADCHDSCVNRPWETNGFSIDNGKCFLHKVDKKGYGLYCLKTIKANEFVGEYRGRVYPAQIFDNESRQSYAFTIPESGHVIDAFEQGSAMRILNHACYCNCSTVVYLHQGKYKVVVVAEQDIIPGEEITINYSWTVEPGEPRLECLCNHPDCKDYVQEFSYRRLPEKFENRTKYASKELKLFLESPIELNPYDSNYNEEHIFHEYDPVSVIYLDDESFILTNGRVVGCFDTPFGFYFYTVLIHRPCTKYIHLPRWMLFRNSERAEFMLTKVFTDIDLQTMRSYFEKENTKRIARKEKIEVLPNYRKRLVEGTLPDLQAHLRQVTGFVAAGINIVELHPSQHQSGSRSSQFNGSTMKPFSNESLEYSNGHNTAREVFDSNTVGSAHLVQDNDGDLQPLLRQSILSPTPSIRNDEDSRQCSPEPEQILYDPLNYGDINQVLESIKLEFYYQRIINNACETLAVLAKARSPQKLNGPIHQIISMMNRHLSKYYHASNPKDRQFLHIIHYKLALEMVFPGSVSVFWCSLCKHEKTYGRLSTLRRHYEDKHAICTQKYSCSNCGEEFKYPSAYRNHVKDCEPEKAVMFRNDIPVEIMDTFADYVSLKGGINAVLQIVHPGVPSRKGTAPRRTFPVTTMDVDNMKPINDEIQVVPINFQMQKTYAMVDLENPLGTIKPPMKNSKKVRGVVATKKPKSLPAQTSKKRKRVNETTAITINNTSMVMNSPKLAKINSRCVFIKPAAPVLVGETSTLANIRPPGPPRISPSSSLLPPRKYPLSRNRKKHQTEPNQNNDQAEKRDDEDVGRK